MAVNRKARNQGMNWIRKEKRLAIYLRDGLACVYCGDAVEDGARLTLDHLVPHSKDGSNAADNLVTCCAQCNSVRQDRDYIAFASDVAQYVHGDDVYAKSIVDRIRQLIATPIDVAEAKSLIVRRGGFVQACQA